MSNHQGQDTSVLVLLNGLPIVTERQWPLLIKFLLRKLGNNGPIDHNKICMPLDPERGTTFGFSIVRYATAEQAETAIRNLNGIHIDVHHQMTLEKVDVSVRYHQAQIIIPGLKEQLSLIAPLDVTTELHSQD